MRGIIHQNNDVAIVISTLAIAALFQSLRRGIRAIIDRRFYRRKYDAARTLAAYKATLRNEVDLSELQENLLAIVRETLATSRQRRICRGELMPVSQLFGWQGRFAYLAQRQAI